MNPEYLLLWSVNIYPNDVPPPGPYRADGHYGVAMRMTETEVLRAFGGINQSGDGLLLVAHENGVHRSRGFRCSANGRCTVVEVQS